MTAIISCLACRSGPSPFVDLNSGTFRVPGGSARLKEEFCMRFMYIVTSPQPNRGPTPALMEAMHKLSDREIKAGRMIDNGGLMPVAMGAQVRIADDKLSVIDGPFVETKEMIGGYAIFELRDKEEAVAMAVEFMQLHKEHMPGWEGTCEVRSFATPGAEMSCQIDAKAAARDKVIS
jgi:hypothetical protein